MQKLKTPLSFLSKINFAISVPMLIYRFLRDFMIYSDIVTFFLPQSET